MDSTDVVVSSGCDSTSMVVDASPGPSVSSGMFDDVTPEEEFEYKLNCIKQQRRIISARAKKHYQVKAKDFNRWRR